MRLYVRALERVAPTWWEELCMEEAGAAVALGGAGGGAVGSGPALSDGGAATQAPVLPSAASLANVAALRPAVPGRWEALGVEGRPPPARYMHAAAAAPGGGLLVFGGDSGARLLSAADMWRLNPEPLAWHLERPPSSCDAGELPPALSAHTVTRWGHHLVVVGGFSRASAQEPLLSTVHLFDLQERAWSRVAVGAPPRPRAATTPRPCWAARGSSYLEGRRPPLRWPLGTSTSWIWRLWPGWTWMQQCRAGRRSQPRARLPSPPRRPAVGT